MEKLFDKTGAVYAFDHEHEGIAYVRPMVKTVTQTTSYYGDDFGEDESYEPADYLITLDRTKVFSSPPVEEVNQEIISKRAELSALRAESARVIRDLNSQRSTVEQKLKSAERQLDEWMKTHRVMTDLGKLLDGQTLYPLSVSKNHYHRSRSIPRIPKMDNVKLLAIHSGNFERGQKWVLEQYGMDTYGTPFRFFDTEEERADAIGSEFSEACQAFRKNPNFETTSHTTITNLHYGTLMEWVKAHPALTIPKDIEAEKAAHDAKAVESKKAALKAQLEELST